MPEKITILMATFNGACFLGAQLDSIARQSHRDWRLWVGDDGSTDATRAMIAAFAAAHPNRDIRLLDGPRRGSAANFLALLCHPDLPPAPVAFSDQDDVWLPMKLARALDHLSGFDQPAIYGAASIVTDERLRPLGVSGARGRSASFANALTQNIFSGHTLALNAAAVSLARQAGQPEIAFHDWWLYQLIGGAGGACILDRRAVALYRQHRNNLVGTGQGTAALLARAKLLLGQDYRRWSQAHRDALSARSGLLSSEARHLLDQLQKAAPFGTARLQQLRKLGLRRSTRLGTLAFWGAAALGCA